MSLPREISDLWNAYLSEEKSGVRSEALLILDRFINALVSLNEQVWQSWAIQVCEAIVDEERNIPVRFPLFRRVLFPALHTRLMSGNGAASRMLAGFSQLLYHSRECRDLLPPELRTEHALLNYAIKRDPSDLRSKRKLRDLYRYDFDFCLHELPTGILYGMNGATVEQCGELLEELSHYSQLCAEVGIEEYDRELFEDASFYIPAYRNYLGCLEKYESFDAYLQSHPRDSAS